MKPCFSWLLLCLLAAAMPTWVVAQASTPKTWEIGLRISNLSGSSQNLTNDYSVVHSSAYGYGLLGYAVRTSKKNFFVRVGIGMYASHRNSRTHDIGSDVNSLEYEGNWLGFDSEISGGYELPTLNKPIFNRFRFRMGLCLSESNGISAKGDQTVWQYDQNGNKISSWTITNKSVGAFSLRATVFLQARYRVFRDCYLGLEWRYGPSYSQGKNSWTSTSTGPNSTVYIGPNSLLSKGIAFGGISWPLFSIGYQF